MKFQVNQNRSRLFNMCHNRDIASFPCYKAYCERTTIPDGTYKTTLIATRTEQIIKEPRKAEAHEKGKQYYY